MNYSSSADGAQTIHRKYQAIESQTLVQHLQVCVLQLERHQMSG